MNHFPETLREGRYTLGAVLGEGGMARVYMAHDRDLGVYRAVKLLLPHGAREALRQRLRNEAKAMARLSHPHILGIHDVGTEGEFDFIVMDLARGGSLQERIAEGGPLPLGNAIGTMIQVLSALAAAHASGIVHRDVKPHNILLDDNQLPLLADFGIAMLAEADRSTRTGVAMGSLAFMPPEQRLDAAHVGPTADIYASGCTLFALLTNDNPVDLFLAAPDSPRWEGLPEPVRAIVQRACSPHASDRYETAGAMADELLAALDKLGPNERELALNSKGFFPAPSRALATGRSMPPAAPTGDHTNTFDAEEAAIPRGATDATLAAPPQVTQLRPEPPAPPRTLRVLGIAMVVGACLAAAMACMGGWWNPSVVPRVPVVVEAPFGLPAPTPVAPVPARIQAPDPPEPKPKAEPAPTPVISPPSPVPAPTAAVDAQPLSPVHGAWTGSLNGKKINLTLSGAPDEIRGSFDVLWQGKTDNSAVLGRFKPENETLVLHDTSGGDDKGRYELTLKDQRLKGFFIGDRGTMPLSLHRPEG